MLLKSAFCVHTYYRVSRHVCDRKNNHYGNSVQCTISKLLAHPVCSSSFGVGERPSLKDRLLCYSPRGCPLEAPYTVFPGWMSMAKPQHVHKSQMILELDKLELEEPGMIRMVSAYSNDEEAVAHTRMKIFPRQIDRRLWFQCWGVDEADKATSTSISRHFSHLV